MSGIGRGYAACVFQPFIGERELSRRARLRWGKKYLPTTALPAKARIEDLAAVMNDFMVRPVRSELLQA